MVAKPILPQQALHCRPEHNVGRIPLVHRRRSVHQHLLSHPHLPPAQLRLPIRHSQMKSQIKFFSIMPTTRIMGSLTFRPTPLSIMERNIPRVNTSSSRSSSWNAGRSSQSISGRVPRVRVWYLTKPTGSALKCDLIGCK